LFHHKQLLAWINNSISGGSKKMNKSELITAVAEKAEFSKKDAEKALTAVIDTITEQLKAGDKIQLVGFGTFEVRDRAERSGMNPHTKEAIVIPASKAHVFKAGKVFKDAISK